MSIGTINTLARELYAEAVEKFGVKMVCSKKSGHLAEVQQFIKGHPKYARLIRHMRDLPSHLLPKTDFLTVNPKVNSPVARQFRRHITMPLKKYGNPTKYVGSLAKQLNGRLRVLKGVGRGATWYVPAALGAVSVMSAPPEMRMRRFFEEGFGVLGGAAGTYGGMLAGLGIIALFGLGPLGAFIAVFICASAGGIFGMEVFKKFGGKMYDYSELHFNSGQIYHSPDQVLLEAIK